MKHYILPIKLTLHTSRSHQKINNKKKQHQMRNTIFIYYIPHPYRFKKKQIYFLKIVNNTLFYFPQKEPRKVLPILKTDEPVCPEGKLSCGNGECVEKELFCNGKPDCKDESDENACSTLH